MPKNESPPHSPMKQGSPPSTVVSPVAPAYHHQHDPKDDFDIMLLHEDFPYLLSIAAKTKETRHKIAALNSGRPSFRPFLPNTALQPDQVMVAVERMQQALLQRPRGSETIPRGRYPVTDSIMEDSMLLLQQEHECGEQWLVQQQQVSSKVKEEGTTTSKRGRATTAIAAASKKEAIAIKYAKWQTDILMNWMIEHKEAPFPDQEAIEWLMSRTGLTNTQVVNWTTNVRKRNRKATCEDGKKPHHFIDFLFLAHDRETKAQQQQMPSAPSPTTTIKSQYGAPSHHKKVNSLNQQQYAPEYAASLSIMPPPQPAQASYRYQQQPAQRHYARATPVPMLGSFGQVPIAAKPEDQIMTDFADCWLDNNFGSKKTHSQATEDLGPATSLDGDFVLQDLDGLDFTAGILPSVTNDSQHPPWEARLGSFELGSMSEDDLKEWVQEAGLGFEV